MRLLAATTFGLAVLSLNLSVEWIIALPFVAALIIVAQIDIQHMVIPDLITLPGIAVAAALRLLIHTLPYWNYVTAALFGSGLFYLAAFLIICAVTNNDAIGGGNIKLLVLTGFVLGIKLTIPCCAGIIAGLVIILTGRYRKELILPFGPFIAVASIVSNYWGMR